MLIRKEGKKVHSGFLGEQIPAGSTLHRHAMWVGAALWDLKSLEVLTWGTCSANSPLCSALEYHSWASGLFLLVFSVYKCSQASSFFEREK